MTNTIAATLYNVTAWILNGILHMIIGFLTYIVVQPAVIPPVVHNIWHMAATIATAVIALGTIYASLKSSAQGIYGGGESVKDIFGRGVVAVLLAQFSWIFVVEWLLPLNDLVVQGLLAQFNSININLAQGIMLPDVSVLGAAVGMVVLGSYYALLFLCILLVLALIVAVAVWLVRDIEIIGLVVLAPIAAAITVFSRQVNSWRWIITELLTAIFSQSVLVLFLYVSFSMMLSGGNVQLNAGLVQTGGPILLDFALGVTGVFMSFKAHAWLKGMITGQSVTHDHGALALGAGMALGRTAASLAIPGGASLNAQQFLGKMGLGQFSGGGRRIMAAKGANAAQANMENPDFYGMGMAARANADINALQNPHTRNRVATQAGTMAEVQAEGMADKAPLIATQRARGQSATARDSGARAARTQAMVDEEIAYKQDPQVMAAHGVTRAAASTYSRAARKNMAVDQDIMDQGFADLSGSYQSFGFEHSTESSGTRPNPYIIAQIAEEGGKDNV